MHFRHHAALAAASGFAFFLQEGAAQDLKDTIVGCADVRCPDKSDSPTPNCTVVDDNFLSIGLSRVPVDTDSLEGISWVQGNSLVEREKDAPLFINNFYFGTPPDFSFNGTGACALFFRNVSGSVEFQGEDVDISQGTCAQAMSEGCVSALISRAEGLDYEGLSTEEACEKLQEEFRDNMDPVCERFSRMGTWRDLTAIRTFPSILCSRPARNVANWRDLALSDVKAITAQENSTSNCWPIEPKSYDLALVQSWQSEVRKPSRNLHERSANA